MAQHLTFVGSRGALGTSGEALVDWNVAVELESVKRRCDAIIFHVSNKDGQSQIKVGQC